MPRARTQSGNDSCAATVTELATVIQASPATNMPGAAVQIVGNLLVLAALGFFAPMRFAALASAPRILALAAACSILVETLQYVLDLGRVSSVDDVLLNTAGAGLAALASRHWWRDAAPAESSDRLPPVRATGR